LSVAADPDTGDEPGHLQAVANILTVFDGKATVVDSHFMGAHALDCGNSGWRVMPCNAIENKARGLIGKKPLIKQWQHQATTDPDTIIRWWTQWPDAMIGALIPDWIMVLDIETVEGHGVDGLALLKSLEDQHTGLPETLTVETGSGGLHMYFQRPQGDLDKTRSFPQQCGVEVRIAPGMQCILPPSKHPKTGRRYRWRDASTPTAALPQWFTDLLRPEPKNAMSQTSSAPRTRSVSEMFWQTVRTGYSVIDMYENTHTWPQILEPHGWRCTKGDGESDGSHWAHPNASSERSGGIQNNQLRVFTPNTVLRVNFGYTKFHAYAMLNHNGDRKAAAAALGGK
jgi:hypothetical protein